MTVYVTACDCATLDPSIVLTVDGATVIVRPVSIYVSSLRLLSYTLRHSFAFVLLACGVTPNAVALVSVASAFVTAVLQLPLPNLT